MSKALITGGSSGIGLEIARELSKQGYSVILVGRDIDNLTKAAKSIKNSHIITLDLSIEANCYKLFKMFKDIDILINNAGFGIWGEFKKTDLKEELNMIELNIKALHILTKLYLKEFVKKDRGYILNVASFAAFASGPLMATYYATKAYVLKLTTAINHELKVNKSNVVISALCSGPVDTGFNKRAGVHFSIKPLSSKFVAKYALLNMYNKQMVIIPGLMAKMASIVCKLLPLRLIMTFCYLVQWNKK